MATQTTGGGSTTSFTNTPQAKDDTYSYLEDLLRADTTLYNVATNTITLDVMANDLGGNAKTLFSVEDGDGNALTADYTLLAKDVNAAGVSNWEETFNHNWVRINNGKIEYRIDNGSHDPNQALDINALPLSAQPFTDQFVYAIRLGNGTLSEATVKIGITGANDGPVAVADTNAADAVTESGVNPGNTSFPGDTSASGNVLANDTDVDLGDTKTVSAVNGVAAKVGTTVTGTYGSVVIGSDGSYTYTLDNSDSDTQALRQGQVVADQFSYTVRDSAGATSTTTLTITITGTNDAPVAVADANGADSVTESGVNPGNTPFGGDSSASGNVLSNDTDVDAGDTKAVSAVNGDAGKVGAVVSGTYGTVTIGADGSYTYSLNNADLDTQGLDEGQVVTDQFTYTVKDANGATSSTTLTITITGTNDGPVAHADTAAGTENQVLTIDVLANDTDADHSAVLTVTAASAPAGKGSASVVGNQVQFNPGTDFDHLAQGATETVVVNYTMQDEHGATSSSTAAITVTGTNDTPVVHADSAAGTENQVLNIDVLANDTDVDDGYVLSLVSAAAPAGKGSVSIVAGQVQFNPGTDFDHLAEGATESVTLNYTMQDEHGATSSSTITILVTGTNDAPVAHADIASSTENQTIQVDVLANDSDADHNAVLTVTAAEAPAGKGSASVVGNQVQFNPGIDFDHLAQGVTENVVINYTMEDEHGAPSSSTLTITVTGTNDGPVAVADTGAIGENEAITVNVLANDTDLDDGHSFTLVSATAPAGQGVATIVGNQLHFEPGTDFDHLAAGDTATVIINYTMQDDHGAPSSSTLTLTVTGTNDAASIAIDAGVTDDRSVTEAGGIANAIAGDPDASGKLIVSDVDDGEAVFDTPASLDGTYGTFTFDATTGEWTYTLDNDRPATQALNGTAVETDTLTVTSSDGTATHDIVVTVNGSNDAPTAAATNSVTTNEDTASIAVAIGAGDVDTGDTLSYSVKSGAEPAKGSVSFDQGAGTFTFTPSANANGSDSFTILVSDGHGGTTEQVVSVTINPVNDQPVANDDTASTNEDTPLNLSAASLVGNDTDVDIATNGQVLSISAVTDGAHGTAVLNGDGSVTYTPDLNFNGTDTITYTVSDGHGGFDTADVVITVNAINDAPVAVDDTGAGLEDTTISGSVATNDSDVDGDSLTYSISGATPAGFTLNGDGSWTLDASNAAYQHLAAGATGLVTVDYTVSDGAGGSDTGQLVVTVTGVNDAPSLTKDANGWSYDSANGHSYLYVAQQGVTLDQALAGAHAAGGYLATVTSAAENQFIAGILTHDGRIAASDSAVEGTFRWIDGPEQGQLVTYTNWSGGEPNNLGDEDNIHIHNDPTGTWNDISTTNPAIGGYIIERNGDLTIEEVTDGGAGENVLVHTGSGSLSFADPDDTDIHTASFTPDGSGYVGTFAVSVDEGTDKLNWNFSVGDGALDHLAAGEVLTQSYTVTLDDGQGGSDSETIVVTIIGTNDAPVVASAIADQSSAEDAAWSFTVPPGSFSDVDDGAVLTYSATLGNGSALPGWLTFNAATQTFSGTPPANFNGNIDLKVTASDGSASTSDTFTLTITPVNDAPTSSNGSNSTNEDTPLNASLPAAADLDGDAITYSLGTNAAHGNVVVNPNGTFSYTPTGNYNGSDSFTFTVSDGHGGSNTYSYNLTVNPVNDPAVLSSATVNLFETNAVLSTGGTLTISDVDSPATFQAQSNVAGSYGHFSIDVAGNWSYVANSAFNEINSPTVLTDTFAVASADGTMTSVTVNIKGTNDDPALTGTQAVLVGGTEDTSYTIHESDLLAGFTDVDGGTLRVSSLSAANGILTDNLDGTWTFAPVHNFNGTVTLNYSVVDGHGGLVSATNSFTLAPVNDPATFSGNDVGAITEDDVPNTVNGQLFAVDVDAGQSSFQSSSGTGVYGSFSINASGAWTYTLNNADTDTNALTEGQAVTDTFTVHSLDGTASSVTINVTGNNDAPVITSDGGGASASFNIPENLTTVTTVTSTDPDSAITYSLSGTDAAKFTITAGGVLTFVNAPDFENPTDADHNNSYLVTVTASDGVLTDTQNLTVNITDVVESGVITNLAVGTPIVIPEYALLYTGGFPSGDIAGASNPVGGTVTHTPGTGTLGNVTFTDAAPAGGSFSYTTTTAVTTSVGVSQDLIGTIDGTSANDILISANGGATLQGNAGNDVLLGGSGNDTYVFGLNDGNDVITDSGSGGDQIVITTSTPLNSTSISTLNFERTSLNLAINVGNTLIVVRDQYAANGSQIESVVFSNGGSVFGYQLNTSGYSISTDTTSPLNEGGGQDIIASSSGTETLNGGSGNDLLFGNGGNDTINGEAGNDLIMGGDGADTIDGGGDNDTIVGGAGADTLTGGVGGATNVDTFVLTDATSFDTITDYQAGEVIDITTLLTTAGSVSGFVRFTAAGDIEVDANGGGNSYVKVAHINTAVTTATVTYSTGPGTTATVVLTKGAPPIALDMDGDGHVSFISTDAGATFDYGYGKVATAWVAGNDGILVNDANHDGQASATEIVFATSGSDLQGLAAYDSNHDGQLSSADAAFADFAVWQDANSNGVVEDGEMHGLTALGIASISLTSDGVGYSAAGGDVQVVGTGSYTRADGSTGVLADAVFATGASQDQKQALAPAASNAALIGAIAAAGLAASQPAVAASEGESHASAQVYGTPVPLELSPAAASAVAKLQTAELMNQSNGEHQASADGSANTAQASEVQAHLDAGSPAAAPADLPQGTEAPQHNAIVEAIPLAAASVAMPSAEQLAGLGHGAEGAQHNQVVGQILADALHGGGSEGPNLDMLLATLPGGMNNPLGAIGHGDALAMISSGYEVVTQHLTMDAAVAHPDAAPPA